MFVHYIFSWKVKNLDEILDILEQNPIVAAVRSENDIEYAVKSKASVVFILFGTLMNIKEISDNIKAYGKKVCIHIDLIEGLGRDHAAVDFLKENVKPDGLITTKVNLAKRAKQIGMFTILRLFIIDSYSLVTGIKNVHDTNPDAVEVMPGIASKLMERIRKEIDAPVIAGGLISTKEDIIDALSSGVLAVSTSCSKLWNM